MLLPIFTAGIHRHRRCVGPSCSAPTRFSLLDIHRHGGAGHRDLTTVAVTLRRRAIAERQKFAESQRGPSWRRQIEYLPLREQEARLQTEARS